MNNYPEFCPHCSTDLKGLEIPKDQQSWLEGTHFHRAIQVCGWAICPDCSYFWSIGVVDPFEGIDFVVTGVDRVLGGPV